MCKNPFSSFTLSFPALFWLQFHNLLAASLAWLFSVAHTVPFHLMHCLGGLFQLHFPTIRLRVVPSQGRCTGSAHGCGGIRTHGCMAHFCPLFLGWAEERSTRTLRTASKAETENASIGLQSRRAWVLCIRGTWTSPA